jgi:Starch binding domain
MRWLSFLEKTLIATAGAAAGGAVTAATVNPFIGTMAAAAAKESTEELVSEFLPAQQQALDELLERTRGIESLLGGIRSDIQTLLDAPWQTALLHIGDAARHPANAQGELQIARNALYEAWSSATTGAKKTLIAQQLSVVYALLGQRDDSRDWLFRSYPEARKGLSEAIASVVSSVKDLPRVKHGKNRELGAPVPAGLLRVFLSVDTNVEYHKAPNALFYVSSEPLETALTTLAETHLDVFALCLACALADMPKPWDGPPSGGQEGPNGHPDFPQPAVDLGYLCRVQGDGARRAATMLSHSGRWQFELNEAPFSPPWQAFISGSSPELGRWRQDQAIPLSRDQDKGDPPRWTSTVNVANYVPSETVEYRYFFAQPGGPPVWEQTPNRQLSPDRDPWALLGHKIDLKDSWRPALGS